MANNFNLRIDSDVPGTALVSGDKHRTLSNLINYLKAMQAGLAPSTLSFDGGLAAATGTVTCAAVTNAQTVTFNGVVFTATKKNASSTATCVSVVEDDTLTVGTVTFTVKDEPDEENPLEIETGGSDTLMAAAFVAAINANATLSPLVFASNAAGVVTVRALLGGTAGNAIAFSETGSTITCTGSGFLAGGAAAANNAFDFSVQDTKTAEALAAAINASTSDAVNDFATATSSNAIVTITALAEGVAGNTLTLASSSSPGTLTVSAARLAGGTATATSFSF